MPSFSRNSPHRQVVSGPAACTAEGHWGACCGLLIVIRISPRQSSLEKAGGGGGEKVGGEGFPLLQSPGRALPLSPVLLEGEPHMLLHLLQAVVVGVDEVERQGHGERAVPPAWRHP